MKINIKIDTEKRVLILKNNDKRIGGVVSLNYIWHTVTTQAPTAEALVVKYIDIVEEKAKDKIIVLNPNYLQSS